MSSHRRIVFFDLETGGLDPEKHPITQIAAVAVDGYCRRIESFEAKISFKAKEAAPDALKLNGYDEDTWKRHALPQKQVSKLFTEFLRRHATIEGMGKSGKPYRLALTAGHNAASFDGPFLHAWYKRQGLFCPASYNTLCTLQRAKWFFLENPTLEEPENFKLGTLCKYFGIHLPDERAHDALFDIQATVELYQKLAAGARSGQTTPKTRHSRWKSRYRGKGSQLKKRRGKGRATAAEGSSHSA